MSEKPMTEIEKLRTREALRIGLLYAYGRLMSAPLDQPIVRAGIERDCALINRQIDALMADE